MVLTECLDIHEDDINLLYLTDSETILESIHKWVDSGPKLNLSKSLFVKGVPLGRRMIRFVRVWTVMRVSDPVGEEVGFLYFQPAACLGQQDLGV